MKKILISLGAVAIMPTVALATPIGMPSNCTVEAEILGEIELHEVSDDLKQECDPKKAGFKLSPKCQFSYLRDGYSMKVKILGVETFKDFGICIWDKDDEVTIRVNKDALPKDSIPEAGDVLKGVPPGVNDSPPFRLESFKKNQNIFQKLWSWILGWF